MTVKRTVVRPQEKWFDALRVRVGDRRRAKEIRREIAAGPPPELFGVRDGPRSEFEERTIAAAEASLISLLESLGYHGRPVAAGRVHLLDPEEYRASIGRDGPDGLTMYGHVYLQRETDRVRLIHSITHELVHQAAFLSLEVTEDRDDAGGGTAIRANARRGGLVTFPYGRPDLPQFQGLNEGVTELIAHDVRRRFLDRCGPLDDAVREKLTCFWAYSYLCLLTANLIRKAAGEGDRLPVQRLLYQDYFLGTSSFLKKLRHTDRRAPAILRRLGVTHEETAVAAGALGFPDLAERLTKLIRP